MSAPVMCLGVSRVGFVWEGVIRDGREQTVYVQRSGERSVNASASRLRVEQTFEGHFALRG